MLVDLEIYRLCRITDARCSPFALYVTIANSLLLSLAA
jgi:hypothetical protein